MKNNYLFFVVFIILIAISCKKNTQKPIIGLPVCSGAPDLVSENSFPLPPMANAVEFTQDSYGNVYTVGAYTGTISFSSITLNGGGYFLEKTDPTGKVIYAKNISLSQAYQYNINADSSQNVYLCYVALEQPYHLVINLDKYDSQGNLSWTKQIPYTMDVTLPAITISNTGEIFMAVLNISSPIDSTFSAGFGTNLYVFDTNGNLTAKKDLSDLRSGQSQLVYADALYFMLNTSTATLVEKLDDKGNTLRSKTLQYNYQQYFYIDNKLNMYLFDTVSVKKIDTAFNPIWQIKTPVFNSINTDNKGNVYIAGTFRGTVNFNTGNGTYNMTAKGGNDTYLEKFDASGTFAWAMQGLGVNKDHTTSASVNSFTINPQGYIYVSGTAPNTNSGNTDIFIATYKQCNK